MRREMVFGVGLDFKDKRKIIIVLPIFESGRISIHVSNAKHQIK